MSRTLCVCLGLTLLGLSVSLPINMPPNSKPAMIQSQSTAHAGDDPVDTTGTSGAVDDLNAVVDDPTPTNEQDEQQSAAIANVEKAETESEGKLGKALKAVKDKITAFKDQITSRQNDAAIAEADANAASASDVTPATPTDSTTSSPSNDDGSSASSLTPAAKDKIEALKDKVASEGGDAADAVSALKDTLASKSGNETSFIQQSQQRRGETVHQCITRRLAEERAKNAGDNSTYNNSGGKDKEHPGAAWSGPTAGLYTSQGTYSNVEPADQPDWTGTNELACRALGCACGDMAQGSQEDAGGADAGSSGSASAATV